MKDKLKALEQLVAKHNALAKDIDDLNKLKTSVDESHEKLIRSGQVDDQATVSLATQLQTQLQMFPHRLNQLEKGISGVSAEMVLIFGPLGQDVVDAVQLRREKALSIISNTLKPIVGRTSLPEDVARQILMNTVFGEDLRPYLESKNFADSMVSDFIPIHRAREWVSYVKGFQALPPL